MGISYGRNNLIALAPNISIIMVWNHN